MHVTVDYAVELSDHDRWQSPGAPLLTWINFNPGMDKELHPL